VVATTRSASSAQHLHELRKQYGGKLHITELDTAQPESVQQWAEALAGSIKHVDVSGLGSMQGTMQGTMQGSMQGSMK
jgi:hypothetical protein